MMGLRLRVVARRSPGARHLGDPALGNQHVEIAVDGPEREVGIVADQGGVDLCRAGVAVGRAQPFEEAVALARVVSSLGFRPRGGRARHDPMVGRRAPIGQDRSAKNS